MLKNGLTVLLSLLVFGCLTALIAYKQLQGADAQITSLTLSGSAYVSAFVEALRQQFATVFGAVSTLLLILAPLLVTVTNKSKLIVLMVWLPMIALIFYASQYHEAGATREISGLILTMQLLWFGYGLAMLLMGSSIMIARKLRKKKTAIPAPSLENKTVGEQEAQTTTEKTHRDRN